MTSTFALHPRHARATAPALDGPTYTLPDGSTLCLAPQGWVLVRGATVTPLHTLAQLRQTLGARMVLVPASSLPVLEGLSGGVALHLRRLGLVEPHPRWSDCVHTTERGDHAVRAITACRYLDLLLLDPDTHHDPHDLT